MTDDDAPTSHSAGAATEPLDWQALSAEASNAKQRAYAPYSQFPVGAAAFTNDGRIIAGCNVENASYGLTLCAECTLIGALHLAGGGRLAALVCVGPDDALLMPCGRCRQLLWEHGGPDCLVLTNEGPIALSELLPRAFGPEDLHTRPAETALRSRSRDRHQDSPNVAPHAEPR